MAGFKTFVADETVTAADLNGYLMEQSVIQCTSGTRPGSPVEGMPAYETDTDKLVVYDGASWLWYHSSFLQALKTSNELVNNSTSMQDDDEMTVTVAANATYQIYGLLILTSSGTADFKFQFDLPSGTAYDIAIADSDGSTNLGIRHTTGIGTSTGLGSTEQNVVLDGTVTTSATAGAFTLQWAQNTADATDTTLYALSYFTLRRVA